MSIPNVPRPIDLAIERADGLEKAGDAWLQAEIRSAEQAAKAQDYDTQLLRAIQAADTEREAGRKPHLDAAAEVQRLWAPVIQRLNVCRDLIGKKLRIWKLDEQRRIDNERQEAARKAEEARRKAVEAAKKAEKPKSVGEIARANRLAEEAVAAAKAAAAMPERAQVRGALSGRAGSLRAYWSAEIEDLIEVFVHFQDHADVRECLQKLANAEVRAMTGEERTLPGCKCSKEMR